MNEPRSDAAETPESAESELIDAIQAGDESAWRRLIDQYEGRLLAYVHRRLQDRSVSEDIVQETLVGFLVSLPNYDRRRRLENYLFSICGYKLTDHLRRTGRRPTLPLYGRGESQRSSGTEMQIPGRNRGASSIARSAERLELERKVVSGAIRDQIQRWQETGNYTKLQTLELIFVAGRGNLEVAERLGISQQQVANLKSDFLTRLKAIIARQDLDPGVFPELSEAT
ncbi:RNA polymerase sigma-70 factor (ECF subfamily) [Rhodopirellula rubra]|uniref:RNA polymerase sigma-70 factor (ECF subfamily) n=1 Tax=Aporhodopirellula rubra TaxID=980271 RepID=A0A7W5E497_9BACT|nr:sigma-70 family RNA polymerase sigma factor [Aporhodopirellula rubra]MBB3209921.1 RNA polymerase sigma-70 factor (ECF subfamily) [Aporhodopirellula rubra]